MFFYRNKHMMIDLGTGNNNKINWAMTEEQEFIDIVEVSFSPSPVPTFAGRRACANLYSSASCAMRFCLLPSGVGGWAGGHAFDLASHVP
jgi:hypothetical protein